MIGDRCIRLVLSLIFFMTSINCFSDWKCGVCEEYDCPMVRLHKYNSLIFDMDSLVDYAAAENTIKSWQLLFDYCKSYVESPLSAEFAMFAGVAKSRIGRLQTTLQDKKTSLKIAKEYFVLVTTLCGKNPRLICEAKARGLDIEQHNRYEYAVVSYMLGDTKNTWDLLKLAFPKGSPNIPYYHDFIYFFFYKEIGRAQTMHQSEEGEGRSVIEELPVITGWYKSLEPFHLTHWPHYGNIHMRFN